MDFFIAKKIRFKHESQRTAAILEADLLRELDSKYVVQYKNKFIENDDLIIIMEYCQLGDLSHQLKKMKQRLTEEQIMFWFCQLTLGLRDIH